MDWVKDASNLSMGALALVCIAWIAYSLIQRKEVKQESPPKDDATVQALEKVADAVNKLNVFLEIQAAKDELLMKEQRRLLAEINRKLDELREEQQRHVRDCQDCQRAHQARGADDN